MRRALCVVALAAGCVPTVRAGDYYAAPLMRPAAPTSRLEARWRVLPPPAGCGAAGAPIVLVPALGLTQHSWAGVATRLTACRARVLVDLPGIGEAPRTGAFDADAVLAALADVVDAVAPRGGRVVLAGHSLGGAVVARAAARLGARVEGVVLVAAPVAPFKLDRWERLLLLSSLWPPLLHLGGAFEDVRLGLGRVSAGSRVGDLDVGLIARDWSDHERRGAVLEYYRAFLASARIGETEAALADVRAPTLLLWGGADTIVPLDVLHTAERRLVRAPSLTVRVIPGVGHLVPLSSPRAVADAIDRFVATLPSAPNPAGTRAAVAGDGHRPGDRIWGPAREWFPLVGAGALFPLDGRVDLSALVGVAHGGVDPHWPIESGRLALLVGAAARGDAAGWSFAYLRATGRLELVWRWGGGYHLDGTLLVDPRDGRVGGLGALGYTPSVVPWVRGFAAVGALPGESVRAFVGVEVDARLTGWRY